MGDRIFFGNVANFAGMGKIYKPSEPQLETVLTTMYLFLYSTNWARMAEKGGWHNLSTAELPKRTGNCRPPSYFGFV